MPHFKVAVIILISVFFTGCNEDKPVTKSTPVKTNNIIDQTKAKLDKATKKYNTNLEHGIHEGETGTDHN